MKPRDKDTIQMTVIMEKPLAAKIENEIHNIGVTSKNKFLLLCINRYFNPLTENGAETTQLLKEIKAKDELVETKGSEIDHLNEELRKKEEIIESRNVAIRENAIDSERIKAELESLKGVIDFNDSIISLKDDELRKMEDTIGWLRNEYTTLKQEFMTMNNRLLPPAKKSKKRSWKFWKKPEEVSA